MLTRSRRFQEFKKYLRTRGSPLAGMQVEEAEEKTAFEAQAVPLSEAVLIQHLRDLQR